MSVGCNADSKSKWSEKKMEEEDSVRTVDCLRGRLLAERVASRNANQEAEQLGNKLMELENLLKHEAKSRNRAERRLNFLMKKLQSMNISYISDESEYSSLVEKSDVSSVSSTTSSSITKLQESYENPQIRFENRESTENFESDKGSENLQQNDSPNSSSSLNDENSTSSSAFEVEDQKCEVEPNAVSENSEQIIRQNATAKDSNNNDSYIDEQSARSYTKEGLNGEDDQDSGSQKDNSLAIVPIDTPSPENNAVDPEVLDSTVKEVLDALRHAREQLQSSMQRRRRMNMISVG